MPRPDFGRIARLIRVQLQRVDRRVDQRLDLARAAGRAGSARSKRNRITPGRFSAALAARHARCRSRPAPPAARARGRARQIPGLSSGVSPGAHARALGKDHHRSPVAAAAPASRIICRSAADAALAIDHDHAIAPRRPAPDRDRRQLLLHHDRPAHRAARPSRTSRTSPGACRRRAPVSSGSRPRRHHRMPRNPARAPVVEARPEHRPSAAAARLPNSADHRRGQHDRHRQAVERRHEQPSAQPADHWPSPSTARRGAPDICYIRATSIAKLGCYGTASPTSSTPPVERVRSSSLRARHMPVRRHQPHRADSCARAPTPRSPRHSSACRPPREPRSTQQANSRRGDLVLRGELVAGGPRGSTPLTSMPLRMRRPGAAPSPRSIRPGPPVSTTIASVLAPLERLRQRQHEHREAER